MNRDDKPCDRRQFFGALRDRTLLQGQVIRNELKGKKMMGLADLGSAPAEVLGQMTPVLRPGLSLRLDSTSILYVKRKPDGEEEAVRELLPHERFIYNQMDGVKANEEIAKALAQADGLTDEEALGKVRAFFIEFAQRMICQPTTA